MTSVQAPSRYNVRTPYEVLGVSPSASAVEIRNQYAKLEREIRESGLPTAERAKRTEELEKAYNRLRVPGKRIEVDFFLMDQQVPRAQCEALASTVAVPSAQIHDIVRPARITVNHQMLLGELKSLYGDPPKVMGFHAKPMEMGEAEPLPGPLTIQFDC